MSPYATYRPVTCYSQPTYRWGWALRWTLEEDYRPLLIPVILV